MNIKALFSETAIEFLTHDFFWDTSNEFAPFGNDEGFDAFFGLKNWMEQNPNKSAVFYLKDRPNKNKIDFKQALQKDVYQLDHHLKVLLIEDVDPEIIAICFGELILKGHIEEELIEFGISAIKRQLSDFALDYLVDDNHLREEKRNILKVELEVLSNLKSKHSA